MPANPPLTTGLILWLTAESNVTKDSSNRVSDWQDAFNGLFHATQGSAAAKPLWVAEAFPGQPGIRFAGGESLFVQSSDMGYDNFTIIALGQATAARTTGGTTPTGQRFLFAHNFTDTLPCISVGTNGLGIYEFATPAPLRAEAVTDASVFCPLTVRYTDRAPSAYLGGTLVCQGPAVSGSHRQHPARHRRHRQLWLRRRHRRNPHLQPRAFQRGASPRGNLPPGEIRLLRREQQQQQRFLGIEREQ